MPTKTKTYTCYVSGCSDPARTIGGMCEKHLAEHRAKWKEEHTRQGAEDTRKGWLIGDECTVKLGKETYQAKITDMSDVSVADKHNYLLVKLLLTKTLIGFDGMPISQMWTHPEPVQTYKLKRPLLKDEGINGR